ncbi:MAG: excinuclease ABC subunit UvrC [Tissierellia bacterium]|nr:excinuclease ABC subunit UvrC [Tissierellia bacterium]
MFDIREELKKVPDLPGVYIMKNSLDQIIYVGKAKSLKNRLRQYFTASGTKSTKVEMMVKNIVEFEYIIVENEIESLILESHLIKDNSPKYNILLKDDKQYPYIKVTTNEMYPRLLKTRKVSKDNARYFGPFPSAYAVNNFIEYMFEKYKIRSCNLKLDGTKRLNRPCLNFYINRCLAPCMGEVDVDKYNLMIREILSFLEGKSDTLIVELDSEMKELSKNLEFEKAAEIRDKIMSLNLLSEKQIIDNASFIDQDIIAMDRGDDEVLIQIFFVRNGKIVGREHFILEDLLHTDQNGIIASFLKQFYLGSAFIPREIVVEKELEEKEAIERWLSDKKGVKVSITVPKRGDKTDLIKMVKQNAKDMLRKYGDRFYRKRQENLMILGELQELLDLESTPIRIEAYDISHISGVEAVGSMVVFENGVSRKTDYRKFRIKGEFGNDDYSSLREVLERRFIRGKREKAENKSPDAFTIFPDLIIMDGGKGQVNIAESVLQELGINIPVCGLVKDDFHNTRGIIYNNKEYNLKIDSQLHRMLYRIQEEAHRFAINFHRQRMHNVTFKSELDDIKGIGPKRKASLMQHFQSIDKIKKASIEELSQVEGMNKTVAEQLYNHFRK